MAADKRYVYNKMAGALQEAAPPAPVASRNRLTASTGYAQSTVPMQQMMNQMAQMPSLQLLNDNDGDDQTVAPPRHHQTHRMGPMKPEPRATDDGRDPTRATRRPGMFFYTIEEGEHVLMIRRDGTMEEVVGPRRVSTFGRTFRRWSTTSPTPASSWSCATATAARSTWSGRRTCGSTRASTCRRPARRACSSPTRRRS
jgi:hypothetical protein